MQIPSCEIFDGHIGESRAILCTDTLPRHTPLLDMDARGLSAPGTVQIDRSLALTIFTEIEHRPQHRWRRLCCSQCAFGSLYKGLIDQRAFMRWPQNRKRHRITIYREGFGSETHSNPSPFSPQNLKIPQDSPLYSFLNNTWNIQNFFLSKVREYTRV